MNTKENDFPPYVGDFEDDLDDCEANDFTDECGDRE